jgi:hypothetical protein
MATLDADDQRRGEAFAPTDRFELVFQTVLSIDLSVTKV